MKAFPELVAALRVMLDRMDASLRADHYAGEQVRMYLAGDKRPLLTSLDLMAARLPAARS